MEVNDRKIIDSIFDIVKKMQIGESSGHDWFHTHRVYLNSILIGNSEHNIDTFILEASALLHDVADHKIGYSAEERAKIIHNILEDLEVEKNKIETITDIIENISFTNKNKCDASNSIECKIIQDADRLDAIGAIGIARTFTYGGFAKRAMFSESKEGMDTISHFYNKLLKLKDGMNTVLGMQMAKERHNFMLSYMKEFYIEWFGEMVGKEYFVNRRN